MVVLAQPELQQLKILAEAAYPEECCAILLGRRERSRAQVIRVLPAPNTSANPRRSYTIPPAAVVAAHRSSLAEDLQVLGFVHSHPDHPPQPSRADLDQALWPGCIYGIVSVREGSVAEIAFFRLAGDTLDQRHFVPDELHRV
jgi:proteasome lid subunit RPN8/RPN11